MKPIPTDPYAFQARIMDALLGDIRDPQAKGFPRLDALRATTQSTRSSEGGNTPLMNR